jgi:hypothetical protein
VCVCVKPEACANLSGPTEATLTMLPILGRTRLHLRHVGATSNFLTASYGRVGHTALSGPSVIPNRSLARIACRAFSTTYDDDDYYSTKKASEEAAAQGAEIAKRRKNKRSSTGWYMHELVVGSRMP